MSRSTVLHPHPDDDVVEGLAQLLADCPPGELDALRARLVTASLGIADGIARRYRNRGIDDDDLVQVARLALVGAVVRYVPGRGVGFVAYVVPSVVGELKRHFRDHAWCVRPPRHLQELTLEASAVQERLRHELRREPTSREVADALDVDLDTARALRVSARAYRSVSIDVSTDEGGVAVDVLPPTADPADLVTTRYALAHALRGLDERERRVLHLRFVEDMTQREIGRVIGVSQMQVSRILAGILDRLRDSLLTEAA